MTHSFGLMGVSPIGGHKELWFVRGEGRIEIGPRVLVCSAAWSLHSPEKGWASMPPATASGGGYMPGLGIPHLGEVSVVEGEVYRIFVQSVVA